MHLYVGSALLNCIPIDQGTNVGKVIFSTLLIVIISTFYVKFSMFEIRHYLFK